MKTRIVSKICGLMLFFPLVTFAQQTTVKGRITDSGSGEPIIGAKVQIDNGYSFATISDVEGNYRISNVPPGEHEITFTLFDYDTLRRILIVVEGRENVLNATMNENTPVMETLLLPERENLLKEVVITYIDPGKPTTYVTLDKKTLDKTNFGQDLPYLLQMTPSTVVTSDAGAGVGYTGIRIRGVDPERTNVTLNGIPLNDSESHAVYWVNLPDFASSADQIQVQRGVGTSTNGVAAFGASININTNKINENAYATLDNSYGSFNTLRNTVSAGTGRIHNKFMVDARLSRISSDGYVDRASSNLKAFYLSGLWIGRKSNLRANIFSGKEITYQSWYGTPESVIDRDVDAINAYADRNFIYGADRDNLLNSGRTYNYYTYENEVDNYQQDHYQLLFSHAFNYAWQLKLAGHYTRGRGYYEQYQVDEDFATYGFDPIILTNDTISSTDLIRRRWLDNHFYGGLFTLNYTKNSLNLVWGGGVNQYLGGHFGEVIWAEFASDSQIRDRYYDNNSTKTDASTYINGTYRIKKVTIYGDVQYRHIDYSFLGIDENAGTIQEINQTVTYDFINPKAGLMYLINNKNNVYASVAIANREPVRRDFIENTPENRPSHEQLLNVEAGYRHTAQRLLFRANAYFMSYKNQLILTGQINDVGGYSRTNVNKSYRAGIELEAGYRIFNNLLATANLSVSQNKVAEFIEYVDNYDLGGQTEIVHNNTDLAFSPNIIAYAGLSYEPIRGLDIKLMGKFVGDQFLDNTSTETRKLDHYFISNLNISYTLKDVLFEEMVIGLAVNNLFNKLYENNGYTWGYIYGGERTDENFYYPQAGRHFLGRVTLKF